MHEEIFIIDSLIIYASTFVVHFCFVGDVEPNQSTGLFCFLIVPIESSKKSLFLSLSLSLSLSVNLSRKFERKPEKK